MLISQKRLSKAGQHVNRAQQQKTLIRNFNSALISRFKRNVGKTAHVVLGYYVGSLFDFRKLIFEIQEIKQKSGKTTLAAPAPLSCIVGP